MSSNRLSLSARLRRTVLFLVLSTAPTAERAVAEPTPPPFWKPVSLRAAAVPCLLGRRADELAVLSCAESCAPIPWQLDERDDEDRPVLDQGAEPNPDESSGIVDGNDEVLWMAEDAGRRMVPAELPAEAECASELRLRFGETERWAYAVAWRAGSAPRSSESYVRYDAAADAVTGARFVVGFHGATPRFFALRGADGEPSRNLLDRLKVRAHARFLGIIPLSRNEDDLLTEFVAWKAGPIRVIRRQRQWVRLGWGIRTPIFRNDSFSYRDYTELPVQLRLNFPASYFFGGIEIDGVLDFRDLRGWRLIASGLTRPLAVGAIGAAERRLLDRSSGDWFALVGSGATLIQTLTVSPSLATVRRSLVYREDSAAPPEDDPGEHPGIGYRLTEWGRVDRGAHWFTSTSYAAPAGYDVGRFLAEQKIPLEIETTANELLDPARRR